MSLLQPLGGLFLKRNSKSDVRRWEAEKVSASVIDDSKILFVNDRGVAE